MAALVAHTAERVLEVRRDDQRQLINTLEAVATSALEGQAAAVARCHELEARVHELEAELASARALGNYVPGAPGRPHDEEPELQLPDRRRSRPAARQDD